MKKILLAAFLAPALLLSWGTVAQAKAKKEDKGSSTSEAKASEVKNPLSVKVGGAEIKFGGSVDAVYLFRDTNVATGLATLFYGIPYNNAIGGNISESRLSAQSSFFTMKVRDQFDDNQVMAYLETDFVGNDPANVYVTTNGHTPRLRQYWVDLKKNKIELTAGQAYSWLTPNRFGLSSEPANVFITRNVDPNRQVGLSFWDRAMQVRFAYQAGDEVALGLALENPQQYVGVGEVIFPFGFNAALGPQFDAGNNTGAPNLMPDFVGKIAVDSGLVHVEAAGFLRDFVATYFSVPQTGFIKTSTLGGGGSLNAIIGLNKDFRVIGTSFLSSGGGRYLDGLGPDVVVKPDAAGTGISLSTVNAYGGIGGVEAQVSPDTFFAGYFGFSQFDNNAFPDTTSPLVTKPTIGFGGANSPTSANKYVREFTLDWVQNFWKSPEHGALQLNVQYSFVARNPWYVSPGPNNPSEASVNMLYTDLKYILP